MNYEVEINGRIRQVAVARADASFHVTIDGRRFEVDATRIDARAWSLIVSGGDEVRLKPPFDAAQGGPEALEGPDTTTGRAVGPRKTEAVSAFRRTYEITIAPDPASSQLAVHVGASRVLVGVNGRRRFGRKDEGTRAATGPQQVVAPMPGKIVRVLVQSGEAVRARQPLVVVEAMKMENELRAARDGTVAEVHAQEGQSVDAGALLVLLQ